MASATSSSSHSKAISFVHPDVRQQLRPVVICLLRLSATLDHLTSGSFILPVKRNLYHQHLDQLIRESNLRIMPNPEKRRKSGQNSQQARKIRKQNDVNRDHAGIENVPPPDPNLPAPSRENPNGSSPIPNSTSSTELDEAQTLFKYSVSSYSLEEDEEDILTILHEKRAEVMREIGEQLATLKALQEDAERINAKQTQETIRYQDLIKRKKHLDNLIMKEMA